MLKNQHKSVVNKQSGWLDSNQRPHAPQTRTLTGLSYIPNCECKSTSFLERDKFFPHFFTFSCKKWEVFLWSGLFFWVFGPISTAYWSAKRILPQSDIEVVWTFLTKIWFGDLSLLNSIFTFLLGRFLTFHLSCSSLHSFFKAQKRLKN